MTVFQNWEAGGWDALLPDSIMTPDFPPNPEIGTAAEIASLAKLAQKYGRFALRTNYMLLTEKSPSYRSGAVKHALNGDSGRRWHARLEDVDAVIERQEAEIAALFKPDANFSDQLASGAAPWAYLDYTPGSPTGIQIGQILTKERENARRLKASQNGPLGSESLMDEHLLGEFVDFGDYGIYDGFHRALTPEFKLRRLQHLTAFHGVGLMYRFYELPPFPNYCSFNRDYIEKPELRDDYRAVEILYGNGAYLFYELNYINRDLQDRAPWNYFAAEVAIVGTLQRRYVGEEVASVEYWTDAPGRWHSLPELLKCGVQPIVEPWNPQADELQLMKITYKNGLKILVNRRNKAIVAQELAPELRDVDFGGRSPLDFATEPLVLPRSGWIAWTPDGAALAFSARLGTVDGRVDFIDDADFSVRFVDPRGDEYAVFNDKTTPELRIDGEIPAGWEEINWESPASVR
ncbi:MAG: hypothetical protein HUK22_08570 [Thermoguttaceae bacterium]|nr:hypothetical protein [Thermoguttaceae bacterium]